MAQQLTQEVLDHFRANVRKQQELSQAQNSADMFMFGISILSLIDNLLPAMSHDVTQKALYFSLLGVAIREVGASTPYGQELTKQSDLIKVMMHTPYP